LKHNVEAAQELRQIIRDLHKIITLEECHFWIKRLSDWYDIYKDLSIKKRLIQKQESIGLRTKTCVRLLCA